MEESLPNDRAGALRAKAAEPRVHVIILDGTLSSLEPLYQTNAGRTFSLLRDVGAGLSLYYEPGLQWNDWRGVIDVMMGRGINRQIRRAYGWLASRYRPGDRIFLMGYSRGGYAVRSLAGVIDTVGLLRSDAATERHIRAAYRHYECNPKSQTAAVFAKKHCHPWVGIEMIGVWDTVKSLGINAPVLWRLSEHLHAFHNDQLSPIVRHGYQALAYDETRVAYTPVLWKCGEEYAGRVEQVWFPGAHGDVGGQLGGFEDARPLANISLVWMLARAGEAGLPLPSEWRDKYPQDPLAPALGTFRGHGKVLVNRRRRQIGRDPSEKLHESLRTRAQARKAAGLKGRLPFQRRVS